MRHFGYIEINIRFVRFGRTDGQCDTSLCLSGQEVDPSVSKVKFRLTVEPPKGWSSVVVLSSNIAETLKFRPRELPNFASSSTSKRAIKPLLSILNPLSIRVSLPMPASSRLPFTISSILAAESLNSTAPLISN